MKNSPQITSTRMITRKAASAESTFPAWIDAAEYGVVPSSVMPRIRDNLGLRLVAGRRQEREQGLLHAHGIS
ncbi:MAG TPA: hypothetical protein VGF85_07900 [Opitutaceae bacterium]|jgi:hypothetical protein